MQNGKEVTITYWSKTLNAAQKNYRITQLELLAVVEAIQAHKIYLLGKPFILRTDHFSLQWLQSCKHLEGRVARWMEKLAAFKFTIKYVPGSKILQVDALSRIPVRKCNPECHVCTRIELRKRKT